MNTAKSQQVVILLHGLGRSSIAMRRLQRILERDYLVVNQSYPSQKHSIDKLADLAIKHLVEAHQNAAKIHFVTHSMGGILVRQYLNQHAISNLGRTVMLGPPNAGSELVDYLGQIKLFQLINGPAGQELGTKASSTPQSLGAVDFEVGVIAGNRSISPLYSRFIDGEDDGKVSVARSKVEGMTDHIVMPVTHTFMMQNTKVIKQVQHFLEYGEFARSV